MEMWIFFSILLLISSFDINNNAISPFNTKLIKKHFFYSENLKNKPTLGIYQLKIGLIVIDKGIKGVSELLSSCIHLCKYASMTGFIARHSILHFGHHKIVSICPSQFFWYHMLRFAWILVYHDFLHNSKQIYDS